MLIKEEAREVAWKEIEKLSCFELVILDEFTREEEFGWMFFYQSKQFMETRDIRGMLVGGGGIIVNKYDGSVHQTGSYRPPEYYLQKYAEEWKREQRHLREGKNA